MTDGRGERMAVPAARRRGEAVLVTGGGRRIGAAMARALAADGWFVVVHRNRSRDEAEALLREIRADGGEGRTVAADLADPGAAAGLAAEAARGAPPLTALVNNASLFAFDRLGGLTAGALDRHYAVNLRAPLLLTQAFLDILPPDRTGCVVNMLDNKVFAPNPDHLSYTVSKFGLHGATQALALAAAPRARVNAIAPGITLESGGQGAESFEKGRRMSPLGRVSSTGDIARALRFILDTPSLNGQAIAIDGGQNLQRLPRDVAFMDAGRRGGGDAGR